MENDILVYFPYRTHYYFSLTLAVISFFFSIGVGYSLSNLGWILLIPILFVLTALTLSKFLYDTSKISILFMNDGLWVVGQGKMSARFYAWCDIPYLYHTRSKRGHRFIVLSGEDLSNEQLELYVAKSANRSNPCTSSMVVVLYIDPLQDSMLLLNFLNKVSETES